MKSAGLTECRWLYAGERDSIVARSDAAGNAVAKNSYDDYGIPGTANAGRFQYTGQAWLPEIGLAYYKNGIYSPTMGTPPDRRDRDLVAETFARSCNDHLTRSPASNFDVCLTRWIAPKASETGAKFGDTDEKAISMLFSSPT